MSPLLLPKVSTKLALRSLSSTRCHSTFNDLHKTWPHMNEEQQDVILDDLEEKQHQSWNQMSLEDKKACYYISFGKWGPRGEQEQSQGLSSRVIGGLTSCIILVALGLSVHNYTKDLEKIEELNKYELVNPEN